MAGLEYVQLVASLPALGPLLAARAVPINRVRLQARLQRMLRPEHLAEINAGVSVLAWSRQPLRETDAEFVSRARKGMSFVYRARVARAVIDAARARAFLTRLLGSGPRSAVATLVDAVESLDPNLIDELAEVIASRRRLKNGT